MMQTIICNKFVSFPPNYQQLLFTFCNFPLVCLSRKALYMLLFVPYKIYIYFPPFITVDSWSELICFLKFACLSYVKIVNYIIIIFYMNGGLFLLDNSLFLPKKEKSINVSLFLVSALWRLKIT